MLLIRNLILMISLFGCCVLSVRGETSIESMESCSGGDFDACYELARILEHGIGVEQDHIKAVELYKKACDGGIHDACESMVIHSTTVLAFVMITY